MNQIYIIFFVFLTCISCKQADKHSTEVAKEATTETKRDILEGLENSLVSPEDILSYMKTLSSDEFQGRKPCTPGEEKTVSFLVKTLKEMGIQPANKGSYTQDVPLVDIISHPRKFMEIHSDHGNFDLLSNKDYVIHSQRKQDEVGLKNSDLIWCGYGIVAPELGWNDFDKVDMKGKTAVVMINDPDYGAEEGKERQLFKGEEMTYYGRWTYKYEEADRQGADGLLIVHETSSAGYPWFVVQSSWSGSQQGLAAIDRSEDCAVKGWLSLDAAKKLFKNSKMDISTEIRRARQRDFSPQPFFANANVTIKNEYTECVSQNVVGWIEGSKYPDEYVVYTAHWDHLGIGTVVEGDSIYNGALDNASGVAALLSIAKNFTKPENKPERSVVFLFVTAEEQGLLGSEHYVNYPLFPLEKTVCNLNLDGVNPAGPMNDLTITGLGHSTMDDYAEELAKEKSRYILPEQEPEKGYFFRSDHFSFAKNGVPAFYGAGSYDHKEKGKEYAKQFLDDYVATHYHAPSDEFNEEEWDLRGFIEDADFYYELGSRMANSQEWPEWKRGSEFSRKKK